jgi:hypothetical protein
MSIIDYFIKHKENNADEQSNEVSQGLKFYYEGGNVTKVKLEEALDFMISIETDPATGAEEYHDNLIKYKREVQMARQAVRKYGEQIFPRTLENMQNEFYSITNSIKYRQSVTHCSVAYSMLSSGWDGIGAWGC